MTLYLDNNATTPIDPRVREQMLRCLDAEYGNAGSPHEFGERSKEMIHNARDQIGRVVGARRHEVVFTSGATESNNLALFGLASYGDKSGRRHIVSTRIEHKAVLEPLAVLVERGFVVTLVPPDRSGQVSPDAVLEAVRDDTLIVSVMHVNNETGVRQPIEQIASRLPAGPYLFVDAAQGFGKDIPSLRCNRIDMMSVSSHKVNGPQGVGALIARRRSGNPPPLSPIMVGGGQELGLRPGTLPTALIAGFGLAAELALAEVDTRRRHCQMLRSQFVAAFKALDASFHGADDLCLPHVLNLSTPGLDADRIIEALAGVAAVSDGSACTTICATASHVLAAMRVEGEELDGAVRLSWSHLTRAEDVQAALPLIAARIEAARRG